MRPVEIDLEIGDIVLGGKFKNKRMKVKTIGVDDLGQPTINGKSLLKFRIEKNMPRDKWSSKSREEAEKKVKITEKQLRNLVKQTLNESSGRSYKMDHIKAPVPVKSRASAEFANIVKGRKLHEAESREAKEGRMLGDLASITSAIQEISDGMYGLVDPAESPRHESDRMVAGDEMAQDLEMQIERLNDLFGILEAHFESMDFDPNAPGMR